MKRQGYVNCRPGSRARYHYSRSLKKMVKNKPIQCVRKNRSKSASPLHPVVRKSERRGKPNVRYVTVV
jgi:hypothetical protein